MRSPLRRRLIGGLALALAMLALGLALPLTHASPEQAVRMPTPAGPARRDPAAEQALLRLANDARAELGLRPLAPSPLLAAYALEHSMMMARLGLIGHAVGARSFQDRTAGWAVPPGTAVAEVIAVADTPEHAMQALLASPEHRAILLDREFRSIGWGAVDTAWGIVATGDLEDR